MSYSNSSLNTFTSCPAKYKHAYILRTPPEKVSPHLEFGTMAHNILYQAGTLRDDAKINNEMDYRQCIPDEHDFSNLKTEFDIPNWQSYFMPVIRSVRDIENKLRKDLHDETNQPIIVARELKIEMTGQEVAMATQQKYHQPLTGVIDLLIMSGDRAIIIDYKFSSQRKSQDDFDMNSQLPLYAFFVSNICGIKPHNIQYGYIDIPKQMFVSPVILSNGTISRAKSQNCEQEMYKKLVIAVHGEDPYYNCEPGGYYYDCYCSLAHNKPAYLSMQYLDEDAYNNIVDDLHQTAKMIAIITENKLPFLRRYDAYSCKGCEYLHACKPWLTVGDKNGMVDND